MPEGNDNLKYVALLVVVVLLVWYYRAEIKTKLGFEGADGGSGRYMLGDNNGLGAFSNYNIAQAIQNQARVKFLNENCGGNVAADAANSPWMWKLESTKEGMDDGLSRILTGASNTV